MPIFPRRLSTQGKRRIFGDDPILAEQIEELQEDVDTIAIEDLSVDASKMGKYPQVNPGMPVWRYRTPAQVRSDTGAAESGANTDITSLGALSEITLTPKASSTGVEGTLFYDDADNHIYVATE